MIDGKELIKTTINELAGFYSKNHMRFLKRDDKVIVFLDDDNYIEIIPRTVCIPCIHDPIEQQKTRRELGL